MFSILALSDYSTLLTTKMNSHLLLSEKVWIEKGVYAETMAVKEAGLL
jgi:hypothetical protein